MINNLAIAFAKSIAYSKANVVDHVFNTTCKLATLGPAGNFVECGVAAGSKIIAMVAALQQVWVKGNVYAYDSFQGIPLPTKGDDQQPGIKCLSEAEIKELPDATETDKFLKSSGATIHSDVNFWSNIGSCGFGYNFHTDPRTGTIQPDIETDSIKIQPDIKICTIKGWFENTVIHYKAGPISYLRLDGDMYSATKVCLEHLYPHLVSGGVLEIDDYALTGCRKAVDEYFEGQNIEWQRVDPNDPENTVVWMIKK